MLAQQRHSNGRAWCVNAPSLPVVVAIATKTLYIASELFFAPIVWRFLELKTTSLFTNCVYTGKRRAHKPGHGTHRSRQHLSPQETLTHHRHPPPTSLRSCPSNWGTRRPNCSKGKKNLHTYYVAYHFYVSNWKLFHFIWTYVHTGLHTGERYTRIQRHIFHKQGGHTDP